MPQLRLAARQDRTRCRIECGASDAHVYIAGNRAAIMDVRSSRGIVFHWGRNQVAQRIQAPGIALGWKDGESRGVAVALDTPQLTNEGGWTVAGDSAGDILRAGLPFQGP